MGKRMFSGKEIDICEEWLFATGALIVFENEHGRRFTMEQFRAWAEMVPRMVEAYRALRAVNLTIDDALCVCRMLVDLSKEVAA